MDFINQTLFSKYTENNVDTIPYLLGLILALTNGSRILRFINSFIIICKNIVITSKSAIGKMRKINNLEHNTKNAQEEYEEVMKQIREMRIHMTALFNSLHDDNVKWRMSESIRREKKHEMKMSDNRNEFKHSHNDTNICEKSGLETEVCL
ncbi:nonstructural protein [Human rotavirus C]|uniref:Nonstructural protein n=5 Tax=Rotavirus C TaxID=36427 RepID=E5KJJ1_9REOV|nr:nonstructural protein NSP4 [Human rotavirus C]AKJ87180.1 nonstructural protein [Human rotavirus C]BAM35666.1 nonstructural protein 4 [Human rotavirus C]BAM35668.1 nonstructural protein 4 [Human rotavirus C]BAM35671.1 nonstructural protein 4 [Human rotavirus C]